MKTLLIEDSRTDAMIWRQMLSSCGLELDLATEVPSQSEELYDCILTDLNLGPTTGCDTITAIRRVWPLTPIVVLTGDDSPETHAAVLAAGATSVYCKDETVQKALVRSIKTAMEIRRRELHTVADLLKQAEGRLKDLADSDLL